MPQIVTHPIVLCVIGLFTGVLMTLVVRMGAARMGFVAKPKADRWHKRPTAMLGGAAIFLTTVIAYFLFVPVTRDAMVVLAGSSFLFLLGLVDDVLNIRPYQKLIGQLIGAGIPI